MTQQDLQTAIQEDPKIQEIANEIVAIIMYNFIKSGWKFWANPFFWLSVGKATWPLLEDLFYKLFKNSTK